MGMLAIVNNIVHVLLFQNVRGIGAYRWVIQTNRNMRTCTTEWIVLTD